MFCNEKWIPALTEGNPFRGAGMTLDQRFPNASFYHARVLGQTQIGHAIGSLLPPNDRRHAPGLPIAPI